ncbi:MAG: hypothetical protein IIC39_02835 [Candidatus Marinimicrobia bacterium]|nr:hypothetical protein [Candidatus Neomarinimicrobiota bacterium]
MAAHVYLLPLILVLTYSCGDDFNENDDLARLAALKTELDLLVGEANCSELNECRALPFGAKPCGGPWEYLIYSSINSDTLKIQEKVDEYNEWNEVINARYGYSSDCSQAEAPQLLCLNGKCVDRNKVEDTP